MGIDVSALPCLVPPIVLLLPLILRFPPSTWQRSRQGARAGHGCLQVLQEHRRGELPSGTSSASTHWLYRARGLVRCSVCSSVQCPDNIAGGVTRVLAVLGVWRPALGVLGVWRPSLEKDQRFPAAPDDFSCQILAQKQAWWGARLLLPFPPVFCSSFGFSRPDPALGSMGKGGKKTGWKRLDEIHQHWGCHRGTTRAVSWTRPPVVAATQEQGRFSEQLCIIWRCWCRLGVSVCKGAGGRRWHGGYLCPESLQDLARGVNIPHGRWPGEGDG